ncbi:MAG: peptide chain release factor 2 [Desulfurivibrio sp.]|nr:peptide chain release factor 2 [Desulfurivibrio sp.]
MSISNAAELKEKAANLQARLQDLRSHLDLDHKLLRIQELEHRSAAPDFWNDPGRAAVVQKEQGALQNQVDAFRAVEAAGEDAEVLLELAITEADREAEGEVADHLQELESRLAELELECMFSGEHDANNAILTIHAGAGGTEAQDWVEILLRMYLRWVENKGFSADTLDLLPGDEAGIKSVTVMIKGRWAYGYLRSEMGIHRLVRISPFDTGGRRHTSFASVFIFPELTDDIEVEVNDKDLRIDTFRASGAGGQHVNKTSSAIRITHLPTNIVAQCQNERSQHRNKDTAMKMLKAQLYERQQAQRRQDQEHLHGDKKEIAWGSQIRSYVLQPYQLVKDHRTDHETGNVNSVLDGNIDPFIKSYLLWR